MTRAPRLGETVLYKMSQQDADDINNRRRHALNNMSEHKHNATGVVIHVGVDVMQGEIFPMVITKVWGDQPGGAVNGQVILDGNDTFWASSTTEGDEERQFSFITD